LNVKQFFFVLALAFAFFVPYFFKTWLIGYDSYYYLRVWDIGSNVLYAKAMLFFLLCASALSISLLGEAISKKNGWLAGILVFLSPVFLQEFFKLETEAIAFPILFMSLFFFTKEGKLNKIVGAAFVAIASFFWLPSFTWIIPASFLFPLLAFFWIPFIPFGINNIGYFLPKAVQESFAPMQGVTFHWGLLFFGIMALALLWKKKEWQKIRPLLPFFVVFSIMAALNGKFGIFLAPLLAVFAVAAWEHFAPSWKRIAAYIMIASVFASGYSILFIHEPTDTQVAAVQEVVQNANKKVICNNWSYGHLIEYFGGHPIAKAGGLQPNCEKDCPDCPTFFPI
jgi:hypothetical protein